MIIDNVKPIINARISKIETINTITVLVTLNKSVTGYNQGTGARLKAYLPNTVNSNMMLYIPTQAEPTILAKDFKFSPDTSDQSVLSVISGADIALTSEGDIAVLPSGDVKVVTGTANLIQAAILKIRTPIGSLIQNPNYGLGILAGTSTAEFDISQNFKKIEAAFASDDRYGSVLASRIAKKGPSVEIDIVLGLPDLDAVLPININLKQ